LLWCVQFNKIKTMANPKKQKAYNFGLGAEKLAALFLMIKGYRIISRRYRNPRGEIDIIAKKGKTLVIVEVKARKDFSSCAYSITPWKQKKILLATEWLIGGGKIAGLNITSEHNIRFDAILVIPKRLPKHIKDAWRV
jgi:putative endonuclease